MADANAADEEWTDRYGKEPRRGCDILVQSLEREGVDTVFAYSREASMEIHQALIRSPKIRNILCRHEQGEIFAAEGYAKVTGRVGVCIATSGPGATNLVTGLVDAMRDSVPLVAVTVQVPRRFIGTDAFQETPIVEISRQITKHNYLVTNIEDIPRIIKEAFFIASTGRPGPVLVDIPKDTQQSTAVPDWLSSMRISGYMSRLPQPPVPSQVARIFEAIKQSKKPVLYCGGGCLESSEELRSFVELTNIPVAQTLMGLGSFPCDHELSLKMLGMHGTVYANYAVHHTDLLLALGVRFDDRVTGKLENFASHAKIVHVDLDPAEIHKNKVAHIPVCADVKQTLQILNTLLKQDSIAPDQFTPWNEELRELKNQTPLYSHEDKHLIMPQKAIEILHEETQGQAIVTTGVGQHQMWSAQFYPFSEPRRWVTSGGMGAMGFGLPAALGAAVAFDGKEGRQKKLVVDIDGDGSFLMNVQELAIAYIENLDLKIFILNNQNLGMVIQWEDRFYKGNRAHSYLGKKDRAFHDTGVEGDIYPDFLRMADSFKVPAVRVVDPGGLRNAIRTMLDTPGPYLLDVMIPYIQYVLPMIPGGGSFENIITSGNNIKSL
eukprot:g7797.t1